MARPLRSSPITGPSSLLPDGPPLCPTTGICLSRFLPLEPFPETTSRRSQTTSWRSRRTTGSHVPCKSLTRARAAYMPDTIWPINRHPPDLSRGEDHDPVLMSSNAFRQLTCGSLSFAFIEPHLTHSKARLLPRRFPPRLFTAAARGWFAITPCRATTEGLPPSPAQHRIKEHTSLLLPLSVFPLALMAHRLRAPGDRDLRALVDHEAVLAHEFGGHQKRALAEVPVRGQRREFPLRQRQFEARERHIRHRRERRGRDPRFADLRFAMHLHRHVVLADQHHDEFRVLRATMGDEVRRAGQAAGEDWG